MKGLILLLVGVILLYIAWYSWPVRERKQFLNLIKPHAYRLGVLIAVVVVLAYAAYLLPSPRLT